MRLVLFLFLLLPSDRKRKAELSISLPKCLPHLGFSFLMILPSFRVKNLGVSPYFCYLQSLDKSVSIISISITFFHASSFLILLWLDGGSSFKRSHNLYIIFQNITHLDFCSSISLGLPAFGLIVPSQICESDHVLPFGSSRTKSKPLSMAQKSLLSFGYTVLSNFPSFYSLTCIYASDILRYE